MTGFKVTARTIFHLGADLISSDAVALYELVKNAFDAGSQTVSIDIRQLLPIETVNPVIDQIATALESRLPARELALEFERCKKLALATLIGIDDPEVKQSLRAALTLEALLLAYEGVNYITVTDSGHGMSEEKLKDNFLTIGTMSRKTPLEAQRAGTQALGDRPILGEKGVGRLSTMRLGSRLRVESFEAGDRHVNILEIDWSLFNRHPEVRLESIPFAPKKGGPKTSEMGTRLLITQLSTEWNLKKIEDIAREQFSRLNDPFAERSNFFISVKFNGDAVPIPPFRKILLDNAHAVVTATFGPDDPDDLLKNGQIKRGAALRLRGSIDYRMRQRSLPIDMSGTHLRTAANATDQLLASLGPFTLKLYWFNRQALEKIDTIGEIRQVQKLVNQWSGGVMVYRDGFRVGSYGQGADDWLDLDRRALASGGYKVNRAQIIARLSISSVANPRLVDQTNREGLRDSPEKTALVNLLKYIIESTFRPFLNAVESEILAREPVDLSTVSDRVLRQRRTIATTLRLLYQRYPQVKSDPEIGGRIDEAMNEIGELMRGLEAMGESYERGRMEMTVLAGIGLSVASIAHELRQATTNALEIVDRLRKRRAPTDVASALAPLGAQLKTLQTRLRVLDPLVSSGRQVKSEIDLSEWVANVVQSAMPVFERDNIVLQLSFATRSRDQKFVEKVVPGMVVQVIGNLLDNARYWVNRRRLEEPRLAPKVMVEVDVPKREIRISDNGPGIEPAMRDNIFHAFVTTKPVGDGLGLGLFIAREIAGYSSASLVLLPETDVPDGMETTFALRFGVSPK
ncbi:ATP-binding protein [Rhizobium johnstonii]|uniref:sensor histidine kinase n=1 Tax=Rhizobium johnstonii TaxID=3019933 RepID=UPI003F9DBFDF